MLKILTSLKCQLYLKAAFILSSYACYGQLGSSGNTIPSNARFRHDIGYFVPLGALPMQYNSSFAGLTPIFPMKPLEFLMGVI
jgi:hypothetical protein